MKWLRKVVAAGLWSSVLEFLAFAAVTVAVWQLVGVWWALLPAAAYLFMLSLALDRGKR